MDALLSEDDAARLSAMIDDSRAMTDLPDAAVADLARLRHRVTRSAHPPGGGQAIWIDRDSRAMTGASDPRKDGMAAGD